METTNKAVNNFYKLNKEFNDKLEKEFKERFYPSATESEIIGFCIEKCNEARIDENKKKIALIEGRLKSHVPSEKPIESTVRAALAAYRSDIYSRDESFEQIMQAINNIPNMNISVKDLKYRIGILDGTEERISTEGV